MKLTADEFNAENLVGTKVVIKHPMGALAEFHTRTRSRAWESVLGDLVKQLVNVDGIEYSVPLSVVHFPEQYTGEQQAAHGIEKAIRHAESIRPGWTKEAYLLLVDFINNHLGDTGTFTGEQFRSWAYENKKIENPPRESAWGGVIKKASFHGLIRRKAWGQATTPSAHSRPVAIWEKMPASGF